MTFLSKLASPVRSMRDAWRSTQKMWPVVKEAFYGRYPEPQWRDLSLRLRPVEPGRKEFQNKFNPLDWFIRIPSHLRHYEWWEDHLREKHKYFQTPESPPANAQTPQLVNGINLTLLTEHYHMQINLYEKYLDLLIRFNFLDFAITGAIVSFSLRYIDEGLISWAFTFPVFMNLFFGIMLLMAFRSLKVINREIIYMSRFLGFQPPGVRTLRHVLAVNFITLSLIVLMLLPTTFDLYKFHLYKANVNWRLANNQQKTRSMNDDRD